MMNKCAKIHEDPSSVFREIRLTAKANIKCDEWTNEQTDWQTICHTKVGGLEKSPIVKQVFVDWNNNVANIPK